MIADTYIKISRVVVNDVQARIIPNIRVRREQKETRKEGWEKHTSFGRTHVWHAIHPMASHSWWTHEG